MTDDAETTQNLGAAEELDPRVSTEDDGFPLADDADSELEEDALGADSFSENEADEEGEH